MIVLLILDSLLRWHSLFDYMQVEVELESESE